MCLIKIIKILFRIKVSNIQEIQVQASWTFAILFHYYLRCWYGQLSCVPLPGFHFQWIQPFKNVFEVFFAHCFYSASMACLNNGSSVYKRTSGLLSVCNFKCMFEHLPLTKSTRRNTGAFDNAIWALTYMCACIKIYTFQIHRQVWNGDISRNW